MRLARRVLLGLLLLVVAIVLIPTGIVGGLIAWVKFSPPPMTGGVKLPGLAAPVDLVWDRNDVPHVFAKSLRDAYRTLGWLHARDRLWQMETQRRIGQGRLAELVGTLGLGFDEEMRVLGFYRLAEANYATLDPDVRADIDAYTAGVNDYLQHPAAPLPIEFQLLHVTPEPWKPADTLVWGRLMALQLSENYREEVLRAELVGKLTPEAFKELFPGTSVAGATTLAALTGIDWKRFAGNLPVELGPSHASNEWVVDGTLTKSGKPLLANDPHLGLSAPILWYMVRIVTPEGNISGVTFPGVPYTVLGHNDRLAWGATTTAGDVQDLFVEDVLPGGKYKTPDGEAEFSTRDEVIKVRFGKDIHLKVRQTRHGPIISDIDPDLAAAVGTGKAVALSFVGLGANDTTVEALRGMDHAQDSASFQAALKLWRSPEQNIVYADVDGHIGFTAVGPVPLRKRAPDDFPAPGATGEADWTGLADFSQLPQGFDPPTHRFVNANNRVVSDDFPIYISRSYGDDSFRAQRITDMLDAGGGNFTVADFTRMQSDVKEQDADMMLPRMLVATPATDAGKRALAMMKSWDRMMHGDRPEPLIYTAWAVRLKHTLLEQAVGAGVLRTGAFGYGFSPDLTLQLLGKYSGAEGEAALLGATLDGAMTALDKAYGPDIGAWHWGEAHRAMLTSQLFGTVPVLGSLFDISLPAPGGVETVNRAGFARNDGVHFPDIHGPGYRGVFDLSNLDNSRFILATGESGNPFSPHYGDMAERWRDGESFTLSGTADEVAATALGRQQFLP
ncbi:MAG TPA: penicillin acylase family protein [Alphaproteobacteria bacterium]|jgi:penicillin amidase|nr:penicillin acylase family protein [Alphaproteobacteria bacterium]